MPHPHLDESDGRASGDALTGGGYEDWSLAGWRTHLPGVANVREHAAANCAS